MKLQIEYFFIQMDPEINLNALKTEENQEISTVLSLLRNMR